MKPYYKFMLASVALLAIAAVGTQYYETLPGLVIKHPITGAVTAHINGTNGTVTAGAFVGDGSGLTGLPSAIVGTVVTNGSALSAGDILAAGTRTTNATAATSANIQGALGQVYQGTNSALTTLAAGTGTGLSSLSASAVTAVQTNVAAANPTGSVGTTVVNGSATTFMRSDAAPPLAVGAATNNIGYQPVNRAGDTMTGTLALPAGNPVGVTVALSSDANSGFAGRGGAWFETCAALNGKNVGQFNTTGFDVPSDLFIGFSPTASANAFLAAPDTILVRDGAANTLQMGSDAASPSAQVFKAADGSGTDKSGASMTIEGGQSTGTGRGGDVVFRTSITTNSASAANFYSTRAYQSAKFVDLSDATTNLLFKCSLEPSTYCGGAAIITLFISNGTDFKVHTSNVSWSAVNKGGTITGMVVESAQLENHVETAGTAITDTYTFHQDGANNTFYIAVTPTQGTVITPSVYRAKWVITALNSNDPATITPP